MLSNTQRTIIFNRLPNILNDTFVYKYRRDKDIISPEFTQIQYPSVSFSVITHSARTGYRTFGRYEVWRDSYNDVQFNYGETVKATISAVISVKSVDDSDYSAQIARDQVLDMSWDMERQLKFFRMGLDWNRDRVKFVELLSSVELPPERSSSSNCYIYRCAVDFSIEYEITILDPNDNIRVINLDGNVSVEDPTTWIDDLPRVQPGVYVMSVKIV